MNTPRNISSALFAIVLGAHGFAEAQECRAFLAGEAVAALTDPEIDEASGLAASWRNDGLLWTHNDSGDVARVFAVGMDGDTRTVVTLADTAARDWEDMAVGPCAPGDATPCVWIADIGDNDAVRAQVALHRFTEPELGAAPPSALTVDDVTTFSVTYADGPRDAETLLVHPVDGRIFIVDKMVGVPSNIWLVSTDGAPAQLVGSTTLGEVGIISNRITGGDFAPDGSEFSIRTYTHVYTFCGADPAAAFSSVSPSSVIAVSLQQSEALTYRRDGRALVTTSEIRTTGQPPLVVMPLDPASTATNDDAGPAPDVGAAPAMDVGTAPDLGQPPSTGPTIVVQDRETGSGCSCATTKSTGLPGAVLLLGALALVRRVRTRRLRP